MLLWFAVVRWGRKKWSKFFFVSIWVYTLEGHKKFLQLEIRPDKRRRTQKITVVFPRPNFISIQIGSPRAGTTDFQGVDYREKNKFQPEPLV